MRVVPSFFWQIFLATRILLAQVVPPLSLSLSLFFSFFFPLSFSAVRVRAREYRTKRALFRERQNNARRHVYARPDVKKASCLEFSSRKFVPQSRRRINKTLMARNGVYVS